MNNLQDHLNEKQRERFVSALNEDLDAFTVRELAGMAGCSTGLLSEITSELRTNITYDTVFFMCARLGINPSYVFQGRGPKYGQYQIVRNGIQRAA